MIDTASLSLTEIDELLRLALDIKKSPQTYVGACNGKIMATLFYEPSTRTMMSFQSAMLRLDGGVIGFDNPSGSSVTKGESLKDTAKVVSSYSDLLVIRAPWEGAAKAAALTADCPVINAGDGGHLHPTQTLTDLATLSAELGRLNNLTIGLCGDLKYGRTTHSLVKTLSKYKGNRFVLISDKNFTLPDYIKNHIAATDCTFTESDSLGDALPQLDVLYMTRTQRERLAVGENPTTFVLTPQLMSQGKKTLAVLHPLPRVDEISPLVDDDPRALYFKQANYGMYVRMSLIVTLLNITKSHPPVPLLNGKTYDGISCLNPKCVTNPAYNNVNLPRSFLRTGNTYECEYCSHPRAGRGD